jgi:formylglycine-generating enzyme required for sulfatase activity
VAAREKGDEIMMKKWVLLVGAAILLLAGAAQAITMEMVTVGNPGNTGELSGGISSYGPTATVGAVGYTYNIGKYEVTAGQYTAFLNAVGATDTYGLYNAKMGNNSPDWGCNIMRGGSSGSYTYTVASDWANRPVNYVSWGDAARFSNWLTNGQPTGAQNLSTTEDGSYYLNGATTDAQLLAVTRKGGARYVIPTENEWYKAAYYDPLKTGGPGYWDYIGTDAVSGRDTTEATNPGNNATYNMPTTPVYIDVVYHRTEVGEFQLSDSAYGTFDQLGNVAEWNETIIMRTGGDLHRGYLGGNWNATSGAMRAVARNSQVSTTTEVMTTGFRVAEVPEPVTMLGVFLGVSGLAGYIRRRRVT